ncbi:MAG: hypothetical protein VCA40_07640 [Roseibacillus sp.]|nr:hypothetical protein [Deltaproteobacteria bacterium]HAT20490.1 hypothetical protein [Verrucomicrobiales bacterium]
MRKILVRFTLLLLLVGACSAGWFYRGQIVSLVEEVIGSSTTSGPAPDPKTYSVLSEDLEEHRRRLSADYRRTTSNTERMEILAQARKLLELSLPRLMRCWLGTPWDFNGIAHEPGHGKVACGYFVSSVLQDAGFRVEWAPLAQQASQNILGTFLPPDDMKIRVGVDYEQFLSEVLSCGNGIYIVGLDSHVAFLVVTDGGEIHFIHSSGASPYCVVDESREDARVLRRSNYRVTGNLTANSELIRNWLLGARFKTRTL